MTTARSAQPKQVYVVKIGGDEKELPAAWVLPWVHGVADALGQRGRLTDVMEPTDPERTLRMQALQIGHQLGWFEYIAVRSKS